MYTNEARVLDGAARAGLVIISRMAVFGKRGKPLPLFAVYTLALPTDEQRAAGPLRSLAAVASDPPLYVRDEAGNRTEAYIDLLRDMGIPP